MRRFFPIFSAALLAAFLLGGCASDESRSLKSARNGLAPQDEDFRLDVELCRKVSRKSGARIGVGHEFHVRNRAYVNGFADFHNVQPDRDYTVHLVWIKPGGKELFRKYAEVRQIPVAEGYRTVINWLDAEDLHKVISDTLVTDKPEFSLEARYNISSKRNRQPGPHHFRVYLDRALVHDAPFTVIGPETAGEDEKEDQEA